MSGRVDYTLKPDSVSVITYGKDGVPESFVLDSTHPTFKPLIRALKRKEWKRVPKLVTLARSVADQTEGNVEVKADGIYYKGTKIDNSLTKRIAQIIKENKNVKHMLRFMDNLYSNPGAFAINELYDWMNGCKLPITDDGCFMAYKRVRNDYKDCHSGSIDNHPGQLVFMKRMDVDSNRRNECSRGLHFCSIAYLPNYSGDRVMQVKINPKDVVSIPADYQYSKGRTWMYEVVKEIPENQHSKLFAGEDIDDYKTAVYSIAKEHRKLFHDTLELPAVKRLIRRGKQTRENIRKMAYGRLANFYAKFYATPVILQGKPTENRLAVVRESYGLTRGQIAETMKLTYRQVFNLENPPQGTLTTQNSIDAYFEAVMKLAKLGPTTRTGLSVPKKMMVAAGK